MLVVNPSGAIHTIPDRLNDGRWYYDARGLKYEDVRIICPICKKEFFETSQYERHMEKHKKEKKEEIVDEDRIEIVKRGRPKGK